MKVVRKVIMAINILQKSDKEKTKESTFHLFRHFYLISVVAVIVILIVVGLGLRSIFRGMVLEEAQRDAMRVSLALRDCEVKEFISTDNGKEQSLAISDEEIPELDHELRVFLAPFDIVKIKIFDTETRIIYSTDPTIIGELNHDNVKLAKALSGTAVSKYENKEQAWDLEGEKHYEVGIVETYVPIYNNMGKIIGSFEIYKDVTEDINIADNILLRAGTIFFIVVVSIFSVLMSIIYLTSKVIKSSTADLKASNKYLEKEIINRENAESTLKQHKEMLEAMFRAAPFGLLLLNKDMVIQKVNNITAKLVGKECQEMIDSQPGDGLCCIHSYDNPKGCGYGSACSRCALRKTIVNVLSSGQAVYKAELQPTLLIDGTEMSPWLEVSVERLEIDSNKYVLVTLSDVSERKQAEEEKRNLEVQLRQSQKMEAVGTLAGGIAHDFNNILGSIIGYTNLALDDVPDDTIVNDNLKQVLIAGSRAKDLVRQILTFSRHDEQQKKPVEIASVVRETLILLRSSFPATIEIKQNIEADSSMILADSTQIHQVVMNLCTNALGAMGDTKGVLEVSLKDVDLKSDTVFSHKKLQAGQYIKLSVKDTGCGIDSAIMERIFEPFFTTKDVGEGTGMGLAVIHGIVENHGGTISIDSEVGVGTTFNVFFPKIERSDVSEDGPSEIIVGQGEVILVVDDEKSLVDMMKQMLHRAGYTVVGKTSSTEALETFRAEPDKFDLVITDYAMPDMTGKELAKELLEIRPDIGVILCTGFSEDLNSQEVLNMGIKAFVMKPMDREEITLIIRNILDKKEIAV